LGPTTTNSIKIGVILIRDFADPSVSVFLISYLHKTTVETLNSHPNYNSISETTAFVIFKKIRILKYS